MKHKKLVASMMLVMASSLHAGETDPMLMPAMESALAPHSLALDIERAGDRLVAVGARGHVLLSDDEGKSWRQGKVPVSLTLTSAVFIDDKSGWVGSHDGVVLHTEDSGETWVKQLDGNALNKLFAEAAPVWFEEAEAAMAAAEEAGDDDAIANLEEQIEYLDFLVGESEYAQEEGPTRPVLDIHFADANNGYIVGAFGMILKTSDGGKSWLPIHNRVFNIDGFHMNAVNVVGDSVFVAAEYGALFRSKDGGETFEQLDLGYDGSLFGVMGEGDQLITYGLRGKVFSSIDGGDSWAEVDSNFASTLSGGRIAADGTWYLTGNSGVVLSSADKGLSWKREDIRGLPNNAIIDAGDKLIVAGLAGVKVIEN